MRLLHRKEPFLNKHIALYSRTAVSFSPRDSAGGIKSFQSLKLFGIPSTPRVRISPNLFCMHPFDTCQNIVRNHTTLTSTSRYWTFSNSLVAVEPRHPAVRDEDATTHQPHSSSSPSSALHTLSPHRFSTAAGPTRSDPHAAAPEQGRPPTSRRSVAGEALLNGAFAARARAGRYTCLSWRSCATLACVRRLVAHTGARGSANLRPETGGKVSWQLVSVCEGRKERWVCVWEPSERGMDA